MVGYWIRWLILLDISILYFHISYTKHTNEAAGEKYGPWRWIPFTVTFEAVILLQ